MSELMEYVDVLVANEEDAGKLNIDGYKNVAEKLMNKFDFENVGSHLRESRSASDNGWLVALYDSKKFVKSIKYNIHIVDRIGGGDSFAAGLVYSIISNKSLQEAAEFSAAWQ